MNTRSFHIRILVICFVANLLGLIFPISLLRAEQSPHSQPFTVKNNSSNFSNTTYEHLGLSFIPNEGRYNSNIAFYTFALGGTVQFSPTGVRMVLPSPTVLNDTNTRENRYRSPKPQILQMQFVGTDSVPTIEADGDTIGTFSLSVGAKPKMILPTYKGIIYRELYPGISAYYRGTTDRLTSTFVVMPQTNADALRWRYQGASSLTIDSTSGDLLITLPRANRLATQVPATLIRESAPIAWQDIRGEQVSVPIQFDLNADGTVGFKIGTYDSSSMLIIDPDTAVADLGNSQSYALTVDNQGHSYVAGSSYDGNSGFDLLVSVIDSDGTTILDTTSLVGAGDEQAHSIDFDSQGRLLVSGWTSSDALSVTGGTAGFRGQICAQFETEIYYCPDGILVRYAITRDPDTNTPRLEQVWASYMGQFGTNAMAIRSDNTIVLGSTTPVHDGRQEAIVTALAWNETSQQFSSLYEKTLIGRGLAEIRAMIAGEDRDIYLTGDSLQAYDENVEGSGSWRAWVAHLDATGNIIKETYLGSGYGNQKANGIARDQQGNIYIVGENESYDAFPPLAPLSGDYDGGGGGEIWRIGFVAELSADLETVYASRIAGEGGVSVTVDPAGRVYIPTYRGLDYPNGVLITIEPNGAGWGTESTLPSGFTDSTAAAVDVAGNVYVAGSGVLKKIGDNPYPEVPTPSHEPVPYTQSYYMQTTDSTVSRYMGCLNRKDISEDGIVVLFFGRPIIQNGVYGSSLIQNPDTKTSNPVAEFVSINNIQTAVQAFSDGYSNPSQCQNEFGVSIPTSGTVPQLVIAVATSNSPVDKKETIPNPYLTFDHGQAWGQMVINLMNYTAQQNYPVSVAGAYDAEGRWAAVNGRQRTLNWAYGFASKDVRTLPDGNVESRGLTYYFIGSMDGGPRDSKWRWSSEYDNTLELFYQLSYGIPIAKALPQIYHAALAKEWYQMLRYARQVHDKPMTLAGVLSEATSSAVDVNESGPWQEVALDLVYNKGVIQDLAPHQAWQAMYDALNRTLFIGTRLKRNFGSPLPDSFLVPPGDIATPEFQTELKVIQDSCEIQYIVYIGGFYGDGSMNQPNNRVSKNTCLGAGTKFPVDSTFSQQFHLPQDILVAYNPLTAQDIPWSTDIGWGLSPRDLP